MDLDVPGYNERILFVGENGCGKSTLARAMLSSGWIQRYVAIDQKGDFPLDGELVITDPSDKRLLSHKPEHERVVFRAIGEYGEGWAIDYLLHRLFVRGQREGKRRPFVVYVDEAYALSRTQHTKWLAQICVAGRSMGVGLWVSSQRPRWIPTEVRSEAWRFYVFHLGFEEDEKEILKYTKSQLSLPQLQEATDNYSFIEIRRDPDRAGHRLIRRCPPVDLATV